MARLAGTREGLEGDFPSSIGYRTVGSTLGADVQPSVFVCAEWPEVAGSRRSSDEFHPWPPNGGFRPLSAIEAQDANGRLWVIPA